MKLVYSKQIIYCGLSSLSKLTSVHQKLLSMIGALTACYLEFVMIVLDHTYM